MNSDETRHHQSAPGRGSGVIEWRADLGTHPAAQVRALGDFVHYLTNYADGEYELFRGQREAWPLLPHICRLVTIHGRMPDEQPLLESFKRHALSYLPTRPENDWAWRALARHHGLPTRLLDWTRNPLAALWFAVETPASGAREAVIWHLSYTVANELHPNQHPWGHMPAPVVFDPPHVAPRIRAQSAVFVSMPIDPAKLVPLECMYVPGFKLTKLVVAPDDFRGLRYDLDRCDVNAASLYADLDGVGRHLTWLNSLAADEVDP